MPTALFHPSLPVLTVQEIRQCELSFGQNAQPSLMQRAGQAAAQLALTLLPQAQGAKVLVIAGAGNNGGDGFVVARELKAAGCYVRVLFLGEPDKLPTDARAAYQAWIEMSGKVLADQALGEEAEFDEDLLIDALLGIGIDRPVQGIYEKWISRINRFAGKVLSLDVPSGLNADTGAVMGCAVAATHTLTFISLKPGLLTYEGPDQCGKLTLDTLNLPVAHEQAATCIGQGNFLDQLKPRKLNSNKGTYGQAGIIGGARGMQGAAILAARAALKLGAGKVFVGLLDQDSLLDPLQPELMFRNASQVSTHATALAVGVGLGQTHEAKVAVENALNFTGALVLDADALNLIGKHEDLQTQLAQRTEPTAITPHPAEAARLLQCTVAQVQQNRIEAAQQMAAQYQVWVVLKGCGTLICSPEGAWHINATGHAGLASAGTGDVLTGLILALLAQGWPMPQALMAAVHLHGLAAQSLSDQGIGPIGLTAGELIDAARSVFNAWVRG